MDAELLFVTFEEGVEVPFLFEDSRLDMITRRRFETMRHYERVLDQYEHELKRIRDELRRSPNDHSLHQMETIYRNRISETRIKMDTQVQELYDEENAERDKLKDFHDRQREAQQSSRPAMKSMLMYGFGNGAMQGA
jgi:hypothetical protein